MKRLSIVVLLAVAVMVVPASLRAQSNESSIRYDQENEKAVRQLYNAFEDAWNRHAVDDMANHWALDGDHQEPDGFVAKGREEIRALLNKQHSSVFKTTVLDLSITAVWFITAEVALIDGTYSVAGIIDPNGNELPPRNGHLTAILLKERNEWAIAADRLMIPAPLPWKP